MRKENIEIMIYKDLIFKIAIITLSFISIIPLFFILFYVIQKGISVINWNFLIALPRPVGESGSGISNAIIGSLMLILISTILSVPIGIFAGIYLSENRQSKISYILRLCVEILQGIPSIVIGIIAYLWIVVNFKTFSALSGGIALSFIMIPIVVKSTEETLKLIPYSLKEASLALGVSYYRTIVKVILPAGLSGIITGILLSISRVMGETAPLLFTAFGNPFMNYNVMKPVNSLPLIIFNYATSPYDDWHSLAWGASFVLIVMVLLINFISKVVTKKWKVQF